MSQPALPSTQHQDPTLVGWLSSHTALAWAATAALTSILGFGLALPQVATDMAQAGGPTGDQWTQIAFAAGDCLPPQRRGAGHQVAGVDPVVSLGHGRARHGVPHPRVEVRTR